VLYKPNPTGKHFKRIRFCSVLIKSKSPEGDPRACLRMAPVTLRRNGNLRNKKHTTCWFSAAGGGGRAPQDTERGVVGVAAGTNTHHAAAFLTLFWNCFISIPCFSFVSM
jgi:hypothetical protein